MISLLLACAASTPDSADPGDSGDSGLLVEGCHAQPRSEDRHALWLSFPYTSEAGQSPAWKRFELEEGLSEQESLELGRAVGWRGAWTPDGAFVFLVDESGVVHTPAGAWSEVYASSLTVSRSGEQAYVVNPNWADSGGGVYRASIDCDTGALGTPELIWTGKNASVVALRPGTLSEAAVITRELDGVAGIVHRVDLETGEVLEHIDAFGDDEAIVSDAAWDYEGERLLVADYSEWSGVPTRVAVVADGGPVGLVEVSDPVSLVTAPWPDSSALVVSGYGDAVYELVRTQDSYELGAKVASPALPGSAVVIERGGRAGRVLVVENTGLQELAFNEGGGVQDLGILQSWSGLEGIPGAIALQP